ncbi:S-4TM family putative pore-forming effector, partial [Escherichia coli]|uniref:S-4TM family putative pore-forming effector n=1 Tax=Escherichia coli TaxID=562 RepID=UPI00146A66CD
MQEEFDCDVLGNPRNELKCGDKVNHRIIVKAEKENKEKYNIDILKKWYISQKYN